MSGIIGYWMSSVHSVPVIGTVWSTGTQLQSLLTGLLVIRTKKPNVRLTSVPIKGTEFIHKSIEYHMNKKLKNWLRISGIQTNWKKISQLMDKLNFYMPPLAKAKFDNVIIP